MKSFVSVLLIISTLFLIVFMQMEERRMGYITLKLRKENKAAAEDMRMKEVQLAKITRPQLLDEVGQNKFLLHKTESSQVIHLADVSAQVSQVKKDE